jgi:hypothetical protein
MLQGKSSEVWSEPTLSVVRLTIDAALRVQSSYVHTYAWLPGSQVRWLVVLSQARV